MRSLTGALPDGCGGDVRPKGEDPGPKAAGGIVELPVDWPGASKK